VQTTKRCGARIEKRPLWERPSNTNEYICYRLEKEGEIAFQIPKEYKEFGELFTKEIPEKALPPHQEWDHEIKLRAGAQPKKSKIYPVPAAHNQTLKDYVEKNLEKGFIRESTSPAGHPVLLVPKKGSEPRVCIDYRDLNNLTIPNAYPLPLIQELQDRLLGAQWFTKFDIPGAFNRIRIKEGDEWKTAFRTRFGHYEYLVMPFGLMNAPATWQAYINNVLREYLDDFVCVYMDDILIYSRTMEEHVEHVRKVLQALKKADLKIEPTKTEFNVQETTFVGYVVSTAGLKADPEKIQAIQDWPLPKNVKGVQSFLGFTNYYRKFVPG
jgi:hypothetical protein